MYTFTCSGISRSEARSAASAATSSAASIQRLAGGTFPVGTLVVNVTGSFLLGAILRYAIDTPTLTPELRALLTVGFCGGYTTFSTFSYETVALMEDGEWSRATVYLALSVGLSIAATLLGLIASRELVAMRARL